MGEGRNGSVVADRRLGRIVAWVVYDVGNEEYVIASVVIVFQPRSDAACPEVSDWLTNLVDTPFRDSKGLENGSPGHDPRHRFDLITVPREESRAMREEYGRQRQADSCA